MSEKRNVQIKMPEEVLRGTYANQMIVHHTREEFVLDFLSVFPPSGIVNARVVVSPSHLKRMIRAMSDGLQRYESKHGPVVELPPNTDIDPDPYTN